MTEYEAIKMARVIMKRRQLEIKEKSVDPINNSRSIKFTKNGKTLTLNIPLQWTQTASTTKLR